MSVRRRARPTAPSGRVRFDERLSVPWWWWPIAALAAGLLVFSVHLGHPGLPPWIPAVILAAALGAALVRLGRVRVTVTEGGPDADDTGPDDTGTDGTGGAAAAPAGPDAVLLAAGAALLPARYIAGVSVVPRADKQRVLGPELDADAFVVHRPWIGPMLRIALADPADPTPYWLVSARRPERLAASLAEGR